MVRLAQHGLRRDNHHPGGESNVKEIYDKVWELRRTREDIHVFNKFSEFENYLYHHDVTGLAMEEALERAEGGRYSGLCLTTGSADTLACGDYLKQRHPASKITAGGALLCPTMLLSGFGAHRIEGIGDKHIPWIHNVRNTARARTPEINRPIEEFNERVSLI